MKSHHGPLAGMALALALACPALAQRPGPGPFADAPPSDEQARLGAAHPLVKRFEALRYFSQQYEEELIGLYSAPGERIGPEFGTKVRAHITAYDALILRLEHAGAPRYAALARRHRMFWANRLPDWEGGAAHPSARFDDVLQGRSLDAEACREAARRGQEQELRRRLLGIALLTGLGVLLAVRLRRIFRRGA